MNKCTVIGNLTADPQIRTTQDGRQVCNFTVAANRRKTQNNQNPEADFFRASAWDKNAENCQKYLTKGKKVCVIGPVSVSTYQAQDGSTRASLNIQANEVEFLSGKNDGDQGNTQSVSEAQSNVEPNLTPVSTDELPFDAGLVYP